ncbi:MAG: hypothetical protein OXD34_06990 [bacterium]|nr:hypothetical protein [bacterium]
MRRRTTVAALLASALFLSASPAFAQSGPMPDDWYDTTDPHDLIGRYEYMTARTNDFDTWEVWVCDPIGPSSFSSMNRFVAFTPRMVVDWIEERSQIEQYFAWLSDGVYKPRFRVGGTATPDMSDLSFNEYTSIGKRRVACQEEIIKDSDSDHDGLLIVDTTRAFYSSIGQAWLGNEFCARGECDPFPISERYAYVDGGVWADSWLIGYQWGVTVANRSQLGLPA